MNEIVELANERSNQSFIDTFTQKLLENKYYLIHKTNFEEGLAEKYVDWHKFKEFEDESVR